MVIVVPAVSQASAIKMIDSSTYHLCFLVQPFLCGEGTKEPSGDIRTLGSFYCRSPCRSHSCANQDHCVHSLQLLLPC
ncbi:hypothetical protein BRADI_4g06505v3 [Brachypodium distachyon]|uniref:Uncharacterized protein n=1 Tax=Brachypodium distachyon TaxID=15368 RepID=A0A2K2CKU8_BRADI|nr:hypothetical protein BRADI_4g06505v3 [Brachypodium distachyon]